ncbi:MAG: hypothetical protein AAGF22_04325 [Pseudomonadota bacterium]
MSQGLDSTLLTVWEEAVDAHPLDRAVSLISGFDRIPRAEAAALPMGARDRRLFALTGRLFGGEIRVFGACAACGAETEVVLPVAAALEVALPEVDFSVTHQGQPHPCRLPDSRDLAQALQAAAPREALLQTIVGVDAPEPDLLAEVETALEARAGLSALTLAHRCADCGAEAATPFDILDYLWRRISAEAQRLMWDIHLLAKAYGWTSGEILGLSRRRRAAHIALVTA